MFGLGLLVLLGVVIAVSVAGRRRPVDVAMELRVGTGAPAPGAPGPSGTGLPTTHRPGWAIEPLGPLRPALDRWTAAGILPPSVRDAIETFERARAATMPGPVPAPAPGRPARVPFVAEAVGYLGGILTIVALLALVSRRWETLAFPGRLGLSLAASALALGAGTAVHEGRDAAFDRLRWALWSVGTAAAGAAGFVLAERLFDPDTERWANQPTRALGAALAVAVVAGLLWQGRARPLQAATALVATLVAAGTFVDHWGGSAAVGTAVVLTAAPMIAVGLRRRLPFAIVPLAIGCAATVGGAIAIGAGRSGIGQLVGVGIAGILIAVTVHPKRAEHAPSIAVTAAAAGVLTVAVVPGTIGYWAQGAAYPTAALVFAAGVASSALGITRRTRAPRLLQVIGGIAVAGSPALTCIERPAVGIVLGLVVAVALLVLGARPERTIQSLAGAAGLLGFVPSAIGWFFPGEGRVPLLILVTGALLVGLAVVLTRRMRNDPTRPSQ